MSKIPFPSLRAQLVLVLSTPARLQRSMCPQHRWEDQVNIVATGVDIGNFVPEDGTNLVDIFPESNHEEKVHLLQR